MSISPTHTFRAIWPITDETVPLRDLIAQATDDLPNVIGRSRARVIGHGRWSMSPSDKVPGSGRITASVLVYDAPAVHGPRREYHKAVA